METNEKKQVFTEIEIPESVTDPELQEYIRLLSEAFKIASKKELPVFFLTEFNSESGTTVLMGCPHCISQGIRQLLDKEPKIIHLLMNAIIKHKLSECQQDKDKEIISYAKKNNPAGN